MLVFWETFGQAGFKVEKPAILNVSGDVRQQCNIKNYYYHAGYIACRFMKTNKSKTASSFWGNKIAAFD